MAEDKAFGEFKKELQSLESELSEFQELFLGTLPKFNKEVDTAIKFLNNYEKELNIKIEFSPASLIFEFVKSFYFDFFIKDKIMVCSIDQHERCVIINRDSRVIFSYPSKGWAVSFCNKSIAYVHQDFIVNAHDDSEVDIYDKVFAHAHENSCVRAFDHSTVQARDNSSILLHGDSSATLWNYSKARSYGDSIMDLHDQSSAICRGSSKACAYDKSKVTCYSRSQVEAHDTSVIEAYDGSKITLHEYSILFKKSSAIKIKTEGHFGAIIGNVFTVKEDTLVYKKLGDGRIATLKLVKGQIFQSEYLDKCRTDRVFVVSIEDIYGNQYNMGFSCYNLSFKYEVGKTVCSDYDEKIAECSTGIHFFLKKEDAIKY